MAKRALILWILLSFAPVSSGGCASMLVFHAPKKATGTTWKGCLDGMPFRHFETSGREAPSWLVFLGKTLLYVPGIIVDTFALPFVFLFDAYFKLIYADWPCMGIKRALCFYPAWFGTWERPHPWIGTDGLP